MSFTRLIHLALSLLHFLGFLGIAFINIAEVSAAPDDRQAEVEAFVGKMVTDYAFKHDDLMEIMYKARFHKKIIAAMQRPAERKPWHDYRKIFVTASRIQGGVEFWRANANILNQATQNYGVPAEIIVAIIGVETSYGRNVGGYRVLDALATLAFGYPKRAKFFRKELTEFLLLNREENIGIITRTGSYAGAMGLPQFMPSSYRTHAVDQDGDGHRDLWNSPADIIASVANYFHHHGWRTGKPIAIKANGITAPPRNLLKAGTKPRLSLYALAKQGITTNPPLTTAKLRTNAKVSLLRLDAAAGDEYWVGFKNFYVITRYNHSDLYAMAVYQLSQEILTLYGSTNKSPSP